MDIEGEEVKALFGKYLWNVEELMVEVHDEKANKIIRSRLENEGFVVKEWSFSWPRVLEKIVTNFRSFMDTELRNGLIASTLALKCVLRLSPHPVPSARKDSEIRLLHAYR